MSRRTPDDLAREFNLTTLEARFCWHHGAGLKGARAARAAGYSSTNAKRLAWKVSQRSRVQAALKVVKLETNRLFRIAHELETGRPFADTPCNKTPLDLPALVERLAARSARWRWIFKQFEGGDKR
jgi:hypothetical protein